MNTIEFSLSYGEVERLLHALRVASEHFDRCAAIVVENKRLHKEFVEYFDEVKSLMVKIEEAL